jgi:hypothetical protein
MTFLSKRLEDAVAAVSALPLDQQNLIVLELAERAHALTGPPVRLPAELEDLIAADIAQDA